MASRQLLEIDSSIMEKNLLFTEDYLNIRDDPLSVLSKQESPDFKLVKPSPGFCVKFKLASNEKIFINVCHTEELPAPRDITEEELTEIIQAEEISDFKIPMSIGEPHEELDKSGGPVTAYDIAINSNFFNKIKDSKSFNFLFLMIAIEGVENKYSIELKHDYTILLNRKCFGTLQYHRIRQTSNQKPEKKKKLLIEEISPSAPSKLGKGDFKSETRKKSIQQSNTEKRNLDLSQQSLNKVDYRTLEMNFEGKNFIVTEVLLPYVLSEDDLSLSVGEDRLILSTTKGSVLVDTFLNANVNGNECSALFNTKCQQSTAIKLCEILMSADATFLLGNFGLGLVATATYDTALWYQLSGLKLLKNLKKFGRIQ